MTTDRPDDIADDTRQVMNEKDFHDGLRILTTPVDELTDAEIAIRIRIVEQEKQHQMQLLIRRCGGGCVQ